jgi:hypothetical protein
MARSQRLTRAEIEAIIEALCIRLACEIDNTEHGAEVYESALTKMKGMRSQTMTRKDQKRIVREMLKTQRQMMEASLQHVPDAWNGIELRQLFVDVAAGFVSRRNHMTRRRRSDYHATCYEKSLPRTA